MPLDRTDGKSYMYMVPLGHNELTDGHRPYSALCDKVNSSLKLMVS